MPSNELIKKEIIIYPEHYFGAQAKSLEARVAEVKLSPEDEGRITSDHTKKFIRDKILGIF